MKIALLGLVILTGFLNFSCGKQVESSPIAAYEKPAEMPQTVSTPEKYEEIDIIEKISRMEAGNEPTPLEFGDYTIKPVTVKKKEDDESPETEIYDAVLTKKGKTIARFEGVYYPLGNFMSFGLYQFLKGSEKQLFIIEESHRFDHAYIVNLSPKFEILFDAADFDVLDGYLRVIDIDVDGEKEITLAKNCDLGFEFTNIDRPWARIIFRYDAAARKFLPASHKFTDYTLQDQDERLGRFNESREKDFGEFLQIFIKYIYAGYETEAWKFFDENERFFRGMETLSGKIDSREQLKTHIIVDLKKDPVYKFISNDFKNRNKKSAE